MNLLLPEIVILITALIALFIDLCFTANGLKKLSGLVVIFGLTLSAFILVTAEKNGATFGGRFVMDPVAWWFKFIFIIASILTVLLSLDLLSDKKLAARGEYFCILLFTLAGMMFLTSSRDLVSLYVSLELATVPLFLLATWNKNRAGTEAGLKYVVLGVLSSSLLLYGLSLLFGMTGKIELVAISQGLSNTPIFWVAFAAILSGVGFKLTLFPFQMWAPDVYEGSPTPITAYLSVASKGAGLALLFLIFYHLFGWRHSQFLNSTDVAHTFNLILAIFATLTMTIGNVVAIVQKNIKRFMAYSSISQAGYILLGLLGATPEGIPAMIFYLLVYVMTNLTVFAAIISFSNQTGLNQIEDYRGLSLRNPVLSLALMIGLFSLAGIPPLSGFVGKFFLFSIASKMEFHWLVAVAAINSTISLYYYLQIIRQMYIEKPRGNEATIKVSKVITCTLIVTSILMVALGIIPCFYDKIHLETTTYLNF
ncbi:MAG: NADH-quinone oxidoreductase subunit N [Bacteriovoracaceae bacterium]